MAPMALAMDTRLFSHQITATKLTRHKSDPTEQKHMYDVYDVYSLTHTP